MLKHTLWGFGKWMAVLLVIVALILDPATATQQPEYHEPESNGLSTLGSYRVHLPVAVRSYTGSSNIRSPFSISIAAIHEVKGSNAVQQTLTEAEITAWYDAAFPSLLAALKESGATTTRVEIKWTQIQPNGPEPGVPANYRWNWYDEKLRLIGQEGIQMIATIEMANRWAAVPSCAPIRSEHLQAFTDFVTELVLRYKAPPYNIRIWELDNEPDSTRLDGDTIGQGCWGLHGDQYAEMMSHAYPAIKAADPGATVLMGGLAHDWFIEYEGPFDRSFPDDVMEAGGSQYFDIQNIHYFIDFRDEWERWDPMSHVRQMGELPAPTCGNVSDGQGLSYEAGGVDIISKVSHYRNRMSTCYGVNKPLWVTEAAAPSGSNDQSGLLHQARYVPKVYARALSAGVGNLTWFSLTTPLDPFEQGLLYADFTPKPAFFAYKTMTSQLRGYKFSRVLDVPDLEGYYFTNFYGQEKLVVWGDNSPLVLGATQVLVVDILGATKTIEDGGVGDLDGLQNGSIELRITEDPVYLVIIP